MGRRGWGGRARHEDSSGGWWPGSARGQGSAPGRRDGGAQRTPAPRLGGQSSLTPVFKHFCRRRVPPSAHGRGTHEMSSKNITGLVSTQGREAMPCARRPPSRTCTQRQAHTLRSERPAACGTVRPRPAGAATPPCSAAGFLPQQPACTGAGLGELRGDLSAGLDMLDVGKAKLVG